MDFPVNVPVDNPNADTEWNDILRKHGIIPEKPPSPTPIIQEALIKAKQRAHDERLEGKDLDELAELEDEEDEEFLEQYRKKRMAELAAVSQASKFNQVFHLQKPEYSKEVTEASKEVYVFVLLTSSLGTNIESALIEEIWKEAARKFGDVKFCQMRADLCIEGYPERNTPTILVYKDTDIKKQIVTLKELGGQKATLKDLQKILIQVGAINEKDYRLFSRSEGESQAKSLEAEQEDDDDWD